METLDATQDSLKQHEKQALQIERSAYVWNTASGLLMAFQSVIMLMVLMRVCDVVEAGIFTIAYANANLFLNIGKYGMRNFQVSDVKQLNSYPTYVYSRIVTTTAMLITGSAFLAYSSTTLGYSTYKSLVILVMLFFKAADSIEDVYMGNCQQNGRLDVAAKALTCRIASTILVFSICAIITGEQLTPLIIATAYTFAFCAFEYAWMRKRYQLPKDNNMESRGGLNGAAVLTLLKSCLPLFLAAFFLFYIGNVPKYAIDAIMDDAAQAYYGFIAMPVFIVSLLASFIYNPVIKRLADMWAANSRKPFLDQFRKHVLYIVVITVVCDLAAFLLGIPVLNALYNTSLELFLIDLIVLITGGGFLALVSLFTMGIAIMRKQKMLLPGYLVVAALATLASPWSVQLAGIDGASWAYFAFMMVLAIWFGAVLIKEANKQSKSIDCTKLTS